MSIQVFGDNKEIWKPCEEFPDNYLISSEGRVWGLVSGVMLRQTRHKTNCYRVRLCVNSKKFTRSVHRLVAKSFLSNPKDKPEVNHKDGNRLNNNIDNLEWCTREENMLHAISTGLISNPFGEKARNFKFISVGYDPKNGQEVVRLYGNRDMQENGYCPKLIFKVITGQQKTHRGLKWKRENKKQDVVEM